MYTHKTTRLFLASLLLATTSFSSLTLPSVQADTSSTITLSPTVIAKLDAFLVKVQALRAKYPSDADWSMFIDNLSKKIIALKPKYIENPLIITVLNRLNSGVTGLKNTTASASLVDNVDLCAQEGLDNIDETNFDVQKHVKQVATMESIEKNPNYLRGYKYKMGPGQSYSFPLKRGNLPDTPGAVNYDEFPIDGSGYKYLKINGSIYGSENPDYIGSISEEKCDFSWIIFRTLNRGDAIHVNITYDGKEKKPASQPNNGAIVSGKNWWHDGEWRTWIQVTPGKQLYFNLRWTRKSDIVDTSGKLKTNPISGVLLYDEIRALKTSSQLKVNNFFDTFFNQSGDTCINLSKCLIQPDYEHAFPWMPKVTPEEWARIRAIKLEQNRQDEVARQADYAAQAEAIRIQQAKTDALPACGSDWQSVGSFSCMGSEGLYQTITTCKPPANAEYAGQQAWPDTVNGVWKFKTGKPC